MAFDNSTALGHLYGVHYSKIRIDIEKQIMIVPIRSDQSAHFKEYIDRLDRNDMTPVELLFIGYGTVTDKGVQMSDQFVPWGPNIKNKPANGKHQLKLKLNIAWNKSLGTDLSTITISEFNQIDLNQGYIIEKTGGGFDVKK